jgi:hypothetical protein
MTTIGQLDTPIWRRRRSREGFDRIYIDETHLFNINELSLFHHLSRSSENHPIAFSVDRSQSLGDRGWTDELFDETLSPGAGVSGRTEVLGIFRCSPDIVNLHCCPKQDQIVAGCAESKGQGSEETGF